MRVTIVQRVLPSYRVPFFGRLRSRLDEDGGTLCLVAGRPRPGEGIVDASRPLEATVVDNRLLPAAMWWQRGLLAAVRGTRPDLVVIEANPRLLSNLALVAWCRLVRVPVVAWGAGKIDRPRAAVADRLSDWALRLQLVGCRAAVGYGEAAAATFARLGGSRLAVGVAPNATVAVEPEPPDRADPVGWPPTYLFVGRLVQQKRVEVLVDASALLVEEGFDHRVVVVGDGPHAAALRARARDLGLASIDFAGHREPEEIRGLMASAHALVLPGRGGLVVQEALSCGLPVVVGPPGVAGDGTVHQLVAGSDAGVVAADPTATGLADAMRRIVDADAWPDRSQAALALAARHGGLDAMTEAFVDVLRRVR